MTSIVLLGGGGHANSAIEVIESTGLFDVAAIVDLPERIGSYCLKYPIVCDDSGLRDLRKKFSHAIVTLGQINSPDARISLFNKLKLLEYTLPSIVASTARVSQYASIGEGTLVMHGCIINSNAIIGANCIINTRSLIEHDAKISDHCHVSTGAIVNGGTKVGEGTFVGSGAILRDHIVIGSRTFITMGSRVTKNLKDGERC